MSITIPTLDLGELGAAVDAAFRADDDTVVVEQEVAPAAASDAVAVEEGAPAAAPGPVAEATAEEPPVDEAEAAYAARFEADYAARSRADIARFQSSADRRYADLERRHREVEAEREESAGYAAFLERQLAEYDPDEVARFKRNRDGLRAKLAQDRAATQGERELRRAFRMQKFPELYPGVDPRDPEILAAFEAGNGPLELALIRARQAENAAAEARRATPQPVAEAAPVAEGAQPPPARDAQGRFLPAERTRELERLRGNDGLGTPRGGGFPQQPPATVAEARKVFQAGMARLVGTRA